MKQLVNRRNLLSLLVVVVLVGFGLWLLNVRTTSPATTAASKSSQPAPMIAVIDITKNNFIPSTLAIRVDTRVIWVNEDVAPHLPAADPYPTHSQLLSLVAPRALGQRETYSFFFTKAQTIQYHDDLNPTITGTIEVR